MFFLLMVTSIPFAALVFWLGYRTGLLTRISIEPNTASTASQKSLR